MTELDARVKLVTIVLLVLIGAVATLFGLGADAGTLYLGGALSAVLAFWLDMLRAQRDKRRTYAPQSTEQAREESMKFRVERARLPSETIPAAVDTHHDDTWHEDTPAETPAAGRRPTEMIRPGPPPKREPIGAARSEPITPIVRRERERGDR